MTTKIAEATETDDPKPTNSFIAKAQALEEEHGEAKAWMLKLTTEAGKHNDVAEVLMKTADVDWPEGCDTELKRLNHSVKMGQKEQQLMTQAAVMTTLGGFEPMTRNIDAFFESHQWETFAGMKDAAEQYQEGFKARLNLGGPGPDPFLDPMFSAIKESNGGRFSKEALIAFLKDYKGHRQVYQDTLGNDIKSVDGMTGFRLHTEALDHGGLKAMLSTQVPGSTTAGTGFGIEPLPAMMDRITRLAQRRPAFFEALSQMAMPERAYIFREETSVRENFGYTEEIANRTDTGRQTDLTVRSFNKAMLNATGYMSTTYEQLEYEPMARQLMRSALFGGFERWLDRECLGAGGALVGSADSQARGTAGLEMLNTIQRVMSMAALSPDNTTAITQGAWTTNSLGGRGNRYFKATAESDLKAVFKGLVHMEAEDYGMSMPTHLIMTPYAYQEFISPILDRNSTPSDQRWLFPSVLMGDMAVTPFGIPVLKAQNPAWTDPFNADEDTDTTGEQRDTRAGTGDSYDDDQAGLAHNEIYVVDMNHMLFRSHSTGMTIEIDRHPRRAVEEIVARTAFQFDVWRRMAIHRITNLSWGTTFGSTTPAGETPPALN